MAKINILPAKVYNRIAAGEVVDRPYSVVKELVENAIDAGASEIEIYIERGGKQLVRVIDNGCGIAREDLPSAFLPHATSKIEKAEDLDSIVTLGFRGEAVASISAVSKMTITSKTETGKCYRLTCDCGEMGNIIEATGENGTDVCVEMLFYNTPVRLGFLKTDKAEESEITNFVSRFILNRSDIAFTYYVNDKKILQSYGEGDEDAMVNVYGASALSECYRIDAKRNGVRVYGYLGNPNFYKANKSYQNVFLNGRYIVNATIAAAISNAYSSYLMKRQYPFYVLHIEVPTEIVDVNVHPNKADVRFADNQIIYGNIYSVISAVLDGQAKAREYIVDVPTGSVFEQEEIQPEPKEKRITCETLLGEERVVPEKKQESLPSFEKIFSYEEAKREIEENTPVFTAKKRGVEVPFEEAEAEEGAWKTKPMPYPKGFIPMEQIGPYVYPKVDIPKKRNGAEELHKQFPDLFYKKPTFSAHDSTAELGKNVEKTEDSQEPQNTPEVKDVFEENRRYLLELDKKRQQEEIDAKAFVYVGRLFNTYLMYEYGTDIYIIDQHAAHERLLFDRLKAEMENRTVSRQPMLLPYVIHLNAFEGGFIRERIEDIREMGFVIAESKENTFEVSEIPMGLQLIDLNMFFNDILSEVNGYRAIKLADILKDKLASAACKAAVKGGMNLTRTEIDELFKLMKGNMGLKCPHGRPVAVKLSKKEIEKMFKRIV